MCVEKRVEWSIGGGEMWPHLSKREREGTWIALERSKSPTPITHLLFYYVSLSPPLYIVPVQVPESEVSLCPADDDSNFDVAVPFLIEEATPPLQEPEY